MNAEKGGIGVKEHTRLIQPGETPGKAYARLVNDAISCRQIIGQTAGTENDHLNADAHMKLASIRDEVIVFFSDREALHQPLELFDAIVDSRLKAAEGVKPRSTRTRHKR